MMYKEVNNIDFKKEMKEEKYSKEDIMVKGKRVKIETKIKNYNLDELIYGDREIKTQTAYMEVWDMYRTYN